MSAPLPEAEDLLFLQEALLFGEDGFRDHLHTDRGWTAEALERLGLGYDGERIVFPVRGAAGEPVGYVRYLVGANGATPKMVADKGTTRELFPPPETISESEGDGTLWLVEGEPDGVRAWSLGLASVAVPGAGNWRPEWAPRFTGRKMVVCFDCDEAGRAGAARAGGDFSACGIEARVVDLDPERADGFDLTDFTAKARTETERKQARRLLLELAERAPLAEAASIAPPHSWTPLDLVALKADPPAPPTIAGLLYPGRRHVLSGEPETMKSWAALVFCAIELRAGRTTLVVDFEMGAAATLERLRDLGLAEEEIARFLYIAPDEPLGDGAVLGDVRALLAEHRPSLIVVDSFTGALEIHGFDPNSGVEVERFYRTVVGPLQEHGAAVALLDHVTKDKATRARFSIGSERKLAGIDIHLGLELIRPFGRGKSGLVKIVTHKDRPGHLARPKAAELELTSDPTTGLVSWQIRPADPADNERPFRPTNLMEKVSLYVGAHVGELPSRNDVEKNVIGKGEFVRQAIDVLLAEGYLDEEEGPRNARLLRSLKPYREAEDDVS
jgi:hypothetical protein